jgi:hypothetical protein
MTAPEFELPLRIILLAPPTGVRFALQKGASTATRRPELVGAQTAHRAGDLVFELTVRARTGGQASARLLGPFVHGPPADRFVYITVGQSAGQPTSPWKRRAKIPLASISDAMAATVREQPGTWLEASLPGTMADGSPTCATQPFAPNAGWRVRGGGSRAQPGQGE